MTDDKWLGIHALDGESEWSHFEVYKAGDKFYWMYIDEAGASSGIDVGPFNTAWEAFNDANN